MATSHPHFSEASLSFDEIGTWGDGHHDGGGVAKLTIITICIILVMFIHILVMYIHILAMYSWPPACRLRELWLAIWL